MIESSTILLLISRLFHIQERNMRKRIYGLYHSKCIFYLEMCKFTGWNSRRNCMITLRRIQKKHLLFVGFPLGSNFNFTCDSFPLGIHPTFSLIRVLCNLVLVAQIQGVIHNLACKEGCGASTMSTSSQTCFLCTTKAKRKKGEESFVYFIHTVKLNYVFNLLA